MDEVIRKNPMATALVGLVLIVIGTAVANDQSLNGTVIQLVCDVVAIAGWVLLIGGLVIYFKNRKPQK